MAQRLLSMAQKRQQLSMARWPRPPSSPPTAPGANAGITKDESTRKRLEIGDAARRLAVQQQLAPDRVQQQQLAPTMHDCERHRPRTPQMRTVPPRLEQSVTRSLLLAPGKLNVEAG
jgi:hypothetical protein